MFVYTQEISRYTYSVGDDASLIKLPSKFRITFGVLGLKIVLPISRKLREIAFAKSLRNR